jgi:glycosyltransferase involved in cell wall biosynthesis
VIISCSDDSEWSEYSKFRNAEAHPEYRNADDVIITMVAAFRPGKDQDTIIRALTKLPENYKAWIIGDGIRRNEIESLIRN